MKFPKYVPPAARKFFIVAHYKLSEAIEELEERFTEYKNLKNRLSELCEVWKLEPCSSKNAQPRRKCGNFGGYEYACPARGRGLRLPVPPARLSGTRRL
jgi:hypothetical protein